VTHLAGGVPAGAWGSVPQAGPDPGRPGSARCDAVPVPGGVPGGTGSHRAGPPRPAGQRATRAKPSSVPGPPGTCAGMRL